MTALRFSTDEHLLEREPSLDEGLGLGVWPRVDADGNPMRSWDNYHGLAMMDLERRLRSSRSTNNEFELGRIGIRDRDQLRPVTTCLALHYLFVAADQVGDNDYFERKASMYLKEAEKIFGLESAALDYDADNSGTLETGEESQAFPVRFIRG